MLSYGSYIDGREHPAQQWVYTVRASAMLRDFFGSFRLKRGLEQGRIRPEDTGDEVIGRCAVADRHDVEAAVRSAARAAAEWSTAPLATRMRLIEVFHDLVREKHDEIVELMIAEGHPRSLARWEAAGMLANTAAPTREFLAGQLEHQVRTAGRELTVRRVADGVVCLNPPQNATVANALLGVWVLAAGNALVVRAPRSAPLGVMHVLRELIAPALEAVGAPAAALSVLCSDARATLEQWLQDPLVDDIMYFGGSEQGVAFGAACVAHGKKPVLELAGNDICVVWHDADLDLAAEALAESFLGSGQICMVPNCAVVHPRVADALLEKLCERARRIRPGFPEAADALLSPVLRTDTFFDVLHQALAGGARLVAGGRRLDVDGEQDDTGGLFLEPTVVRVDGLKGARDLDAVRHETFFPLLPVVVPEDGRDDDELLAAVVAFVNGNEYGLRNSLWTSDDSVVDRWLAGVRNGGLLKVNDSHVGFLPVLPTHGGTGLTGGPGGEANYPVLRTSHLQGVSVARDVRRPSAAVFGDSAEEATV
ncbi:aldehyde dehydrogenase family protein [Streptomyces morookaense]|uniref:aldehyde dehydrogenase family protein n=1 Tax=Streptomyces morookaense TaxID=1970 RepID=UPI0019BE05DD|nr:aldehyde dehydrogenase [Streptomyces morookaense]GHF20574.1 putative aldehyde dehydrogenase [Streptomyces morookaense]